MRNIMIDSADRANPPNPQRLVDIPPASQHRTHISEPSHGGGFWEIVIAITSILATLILAAFVGHWVVSYFSALQSGFGAGWELLLFNITKVAIFFGLPISLVAIAVKAAWGWAQGVSNGAFQKSVVWLQDTIPVHRKAIEGNYTPLSNPMFDAVHLRQTQVDMTRWQNSAYHAVSTYSPTIHLDNSYKGGQGGSGNNGGGGNGTDPFDPTKFNRLANTRVDLLPHLKAGVDSQKMLLGIDLEGNEVRDNIHSAMHTGMLATTGGGKTTTMVANALQLAADPNVLIAVADPHLMELSVIAHTGALWRGILPKNGDEAVKVLAELVKEIRRRAEVFKWVSGEFQRLTGRINVAARLDKYNVMVRTLRENGIEAEQMPTIVAFADEIPALMGLMKGAAAEHVSAITAEGRKFGVYFEGASQNWKANVVPTNVRDMFATRYVMTGSSPYQAKVLLDLEDELQAKEVMRGVTASGMAALWRRGKDLTIIRTPYIDIDSETALDEAVRAVRAQRLPMKTITQQDDTLLDSLLAGNRGTVGTSSQQTSEMAENEAFLGTGSGNCSGSEASERDKIKAILLAAPSMSGTAIVTALKMRKQDGLALVREVKSELGIADNE